MLAVAVKVILDVVVGNLSTCREPHFIMRNDVIERPVQVEAAEGQPYQERMQADAHDLAGVHRLLVQHVELVAQESLELRARLPLSQEDGMSLTSIEYGIETSVPERTFIG